MNRNTKHILVEKLIRLNLKKVELFKKVIKSIKQNNNINNIVKNYTTLTLTKVNKRKTVLSKKNKICFFTGKRGGVLKHFSFSRYTIKSLILQNKLTNVKKANW